MGKSNKMCWNYFFQQRKVNSIIQRTFKICKSEKSVYSNLRWEVVFRLIKSIFGFPNVTSITIFLHFVRFLKNERFKVAFGCALQAGFSMHWYVKFSNKLYPISIDFLSLDMRDAIDFSYKYLKGNVKFARIKLM